MPFIPVPDTAQVELRFLINDQKVENVFHYKSADPWDGFSLNTLCGLMLDWWTTNMAPILTSAIQLREVYAFDMSVDLGTAFTLVPDPLPTGAGAGDPLPNNVAMCLSARSSQRGRSARGRSYVCGFSDIQANGSYFNSTTVGAVLTAYSALLGLNPTDGWEPVVVSKRHDNIWRTIGETFPIVAYALVDDIVDSQRRRLPGRGK